MINILINGAYGKMGSIASTYLSQHVAFAIVGKTGSQDDLSAAIVACKPDIVIDFTNAASVWTNLQIILHHKVRPVIGSSGLTQDQVNYASDLCRKEHLGGMIVPNFSLSAALMLNYAVHAAGYLNDAHIIEAHHKAKRDAPSGTALYTAEKIAAARATSFAPQSLSKELLQGALGARHHGVPVHALRIDGVIADQRVIFGAPGETLTLEHRVLDRIAYMPGLKLACETVMRLDHLVYGLENIILR